MTEEEKKVLESINKEVEAHVKRYGYVQSQVTISDCQYRIYSGLLKKHIRAFYVFGGVKFQINVQPCRVLMNRIDLTFGRNL